MSARKDVSPTLNIGMLSAKDGSLLKVKVVGEGVREAYTLGKRVDSRLNRVMVKRYGDSASLLFDHKRHTVEFPDSPARSVKKRSGWYELRAGDIAVVSMKRKKDRPATNGAGQVYVVFAAGSKE